MTGAPTAPTAGADVGFVVFYSCCIELVDLHSHMDF